MEHKVRDYPEVEDMKITDGQVVSAETTQGLSHLIVVLREDQVDLIAKAVVKLLHLKLIKE